MNNVVAIVGRPNVGKSTLFNRLVGERKAIVDDISGVTRDRIYGTSDWNGKEFNVVDTGGFVKSSDEIFEVEIRKQVKVAMEEAAVILLMVDVTTGITDLDQEMTEMLRRSKKKSILVVNKVDNHQRELEANEFYSLGFESTFFLSSITGGGTGELLDEVVKNLEPETSALPEGIPKFCIVGQPNVGKSSMLNALVGEERNIVTDIPGTTRDVIHTHYKKYDKEFYLIDTAGIRKKQKVDEDLEFYSIIRAIKAIEEADVCILMIDATTKGLEQQDFKIFSTAVHKKKGVMVVVNKWDLVEKETNTMKSFEENLRKKLQPFSDVPIVFTSVIEKQRIFKVVETALEVYENRHRNIYQHELQEWMVDATQLQPPPSYRGNFIKFRRVEQVPMQIPAFAIYCNFPEGVRDPYRNYLENSLRRKWNFSGSPVHIYFRKT
ncbi:MAG TPA: ribosome biogenesis GTPase Der [Chitinophagales bacterium]|nr:ribosome biogenesis GTPase Der [Chitinophagales bacterium]